MKIATFVDENDNTLPFNSSGVIKLYNNKDSWWILEAEIPFDLSGKTNLTAFRQEIYAVRQALEGCKALIVKQKMGILNTIFEEELHIFIFAIEGSPYYAFDLVRDHVRKTIIEAINRAESCKPRKEDISPTVKNSLGKGFYAIDLVSVQEKNGSLSSKDILKPFFAQNDYVELEIICSHTPKWIERELANVEVITEMRKDGLCHAFVRPVKQLE